MTISELNWLQATQTNPSLGPRQERLHAHMGLRFVGGGVEQLASDSHPILGSLIVSDLESGVHH